MTQDEIIGMAREAGAVEEMIAMGRSDGVLFSASELVRFAALVAAKAAAEERETCAQLAAQTVCDLHIPTGVKIYGARAAKAIRARGTDAAKPAAQAQDALKEIGAIAVSALETNSRYIADWREDIDRIAAIAEQGEKYG